MKTLLTSRCVNQRGAGQLIRPYGGLVPDEIVLNHVMFLKVQDTLCVTETWGSEKPGGCIWRLKPEAPA